MNRHLVIAGTGRAGTTFLVQYLNACGLETRLTHNPAETLDENANAGLEDLPVEGQTLPYVIKSPWLFEFVNRLVERKDVQIDAVIIPVRDIVEAATSRVLLEMRARYGQEELHESITNWEHWATTAGGVIYSLNPLDQARILALGFHEIIRVLVARDIPIILLDFPRLVEDPDYLWSKLEAVVAQHTSRAEAIRAHFRLADARKVRTGAEIRQKEDRNATAGGTAERVVGYPGHADLDRVALLRELDRLRRQLRCRSEDAEHRRLDIERVSAEAQALEGLVAAARQRCETLERELASSISEQHRLATRLRALTLSRSWRLTQPLRVLSRWFGLKD